VWGGAWIVFSGEVGQVDEARPEEMKRTSLASRLYRYLTFSSSHFSPRFDAFAVAGSNPGYFFSPFSVLLWVLCRSSLSSFFWDFFAVALLLLVSIIFVWMR
jgi:hypothetical protein